MIYIQFFPLVPVAQGRPRICRVGNGVRAVDPPKSRAYKEMLGSMARAGIPEPIADTPLDVDMTFILPVPKSWSKKKIMSALQGEVLPQGRPDLDNYIKGLCDALNGIVWKDDSSIVTMTGRKVYGEIPGVKVVVQTHKSML